MFSYIGYYIAYVPTNYTYHIKLLHDFLQQVFYKLDKEIEQSFHPLPNFSIALSLEKKNVLIETSCYNNSNNNNNKYNIAMDPNIKINKSHKSKVFSGINCNSMICFVASTEAKNQLDTSYSF